MVSPIPPFGQAKVAAVINLAVHPRSGLLQMAQRCTDPPFGGNSVVEK